MSKLDGKIAVVTGGSSGIGLAIAQKFVEEGAYVFITGRRLAELEKAVAAIGKNVTAVQSDVAKLEDLDRLYEQVKAEKGALDIIVANAGIAEFAPLGEITVEHYDKIFDINVRGVLFTTQKALPLLKDGGAIVVVASVVQYLGFPGASVYSATKAAVRSFVRTWAAELKGRGIRVNSLSPGPIDTPILDGQYKSQEEADATKAGLAQMVPLGRLGRSEEIAAAALFLASSDSSFSTGIDLLSDGGMADI